MNKTTIEDQEFSFGNSSDYILPQTISTYDDYLKYIEGLPTFGSPELVGLHTNANITKDIN